MKQETLTKLNQVMQNYKENKKKLVPIHLDEDRLSITCLFLELMKDPVANGLMNPFSKPFKEIKSSLINAGFDSSAFGEPFREFFEIQRMDGKVVEWTVRTIKRMLVGLSIIDESLEDNVLSPKIQDVEDYLVVRMIESLS